MKRFFSCDWGSTRFRLRLIETSNLRVIEETGSDKGIIKMHEEWKAGDINNPQDFFCNYLFDQVARVGLQTDSSIDNAPILVSGMASSNIGLLELPYKHFPIKTDGSDITVEKIPTIHDENWQPLYLISGARTEEDVVRGEETMFAGWDHEKNDVPLLIFPGTHSKHIFIQDGMARKIQSFLTGEMFDLLSTKSILKNSTQKPEGFEISSGPFFTSGVRRGASTNFLHGVFQVRINDLFKTATKEENYAYLAGMLIGYELKELKMAGMERIGLVCSEELNAAYLQALKVLYPTMVVIVADAGSALIKGQWKILQTLNRH